MYHAITKCRVCGNKELTDILDLGDQVLTGVFPSREDQIITSGPLQLVKCDEQIENACGLLQLKHSYCLDELYGDNYGYRSGLNQSMMNHLHDKVKKICEMIQLRKNDIVIDIGSNDATTLKAYKINNLRLIGVDPTGEKFAHFYPKNVTLIPNFFSADVLKSSIGSTKAKVITSFSMFYDLDNPLDFATEVASLLDDEGIWVCEQSYMPTMLKENSFDTICHEHLEYYGLRQFQWIAERVDLKIVDIEFNSVNGGSVSITLAKKDSKLKSNTGKIQDCLDAERLAGLSTLEPYLAFADRISKVRVQIRNFFENVRLEVKTVFGLGASTKGNVILQYCGITRRDLPAIGEVNSDKYGCYTPGSLIPILPEDEILLKEPDYLFVLPWHFKSFFISKVKSSKTKLIFPLTLDAKSEENQR